MRIIFKLIGLSIVGIPVLAIGLLCLMVETTAKVNRAAEVTPQNIERAKKILDQHDPRWLPTGSRRNVMIRKDDLDLAANYLVHRYVGGSARVALKAEHAYIDASLCPAFLPIRLCVNLTAITDESLPVPRFERLRIGSLPVPKFLANWLLQRAIGFAGGGNILPAAKQAVKKIDYQPNQLAVTFEWQAELKEELRNAILPPEQRQRIEIYQRRLVEITQSAPQGKLSLVDLMQPLFRLAAERSQSQDTVEENRAAILVATVYANGKSFDTIIPGAKKWPRPARRQVVLNHRDDTAKHFIVSAALAAKAGGPFANAVGVYKEIADSRGGSGFSFNDLAADRAGTRFGEIAADDKSSARALQKRVTAKLSERDLLPPVDDLPENLQEAEFKRRYGGIDGPEYKKLAADIERRIAALPLYR